MTAAATTTTLIGNLDRGKLRQFLQENSIEVKALLRTKVQPQKYAGAVVVNLNQLGEITAQAFMTADDLYEYFKLYPSASINVIRMEALDESEECATPLPDPEAHAIPASSSESKVATAKDFGIQEEPRKRKNARHRGKWKDLCNATK